MSSWLSRLFGKKDQPETREELARIPVATNGNGKQAEVPLPTPPDTPIEISEVESPNIEPVTELVEAPSEIETVESVPIPEAEAPVVESVETAEIVEPVVEPIPEPEVIPEPEPTVEPTPLIEEVLEAEASTEEAREETAEAILEPEESEVILPAPKPIPSSVYLHPPFSETAHTQLSVLQETFQEVFPMSLQQWENGFRLDHNPDHEMAVWLHSADLYRRFTADADPANRRNAFAVLTACMHHPAETVRNVLPAHLLNTEQTQAILGAYYEPSNP